MRVDLFLKRLSILRRKEVKEASIFLENKKIKPSHRLKGGELLKILTGESEIELEVIEIPLGNVKKKEREKYVRIIKRKRITSKENRDEFLKWVFGD